MCFKSVNNSSSATPAGCAFLVSCDLIVTLESHSTNSNEEKNKLIGNKCDPVHQKHNKGTSQKLSVAILTETNQRFVPQTNIFSFLGNFVSTKYNLSGAYMPSFQKKEVGSVGQRIQLAPLAGQQASKMLDCLQCHHFRSDWPQQFAAAPVHEVSVFISTATCDSSGFLPMQSVRWPSLKLSLQASLHSLSSFFQPISLLLIIKKTNLSLPRPSPYPTLLWVKLMKVSTCADLLVLTTVEGRCFAAVLIFLLTLLLHSPLLKHFAIGLTVTPPC